LAEIPLLKSKNFVARWFHQLTLIVFTAATRRNYKLKLFLNFSEFGFFIFSSDFVLITNILVVLRINPKPVERQKLSVNIS
jgi:hypothetical protein